MRILYQFPTKSRPTKFFQTLDSYYGLIEDLKNSLFHIVISDSDSEMNNQATINKLSSYPNLIYTITDNANTKISACNFGIDKIFQWDVVVLLSDDMIPQIKAFDNQIRCDMGYIYPDLDGCLWYFDGYTKNICTLAILGWKFYKRFNYIYHPSYVSMWCDNELTEVAQKLSKITYIENCIIKHEHPAWNSSVFKDNLYLLNEPFYHTDQITYNKRLLNNFDL